MRPLVAHCALGLTDGYRLDGRRDQAVAQLSTATMYTEMGMHHWLGKAEEARRRLG
jgi:proteasome assembly chaperone (PAC2) family protein